MVDLDASLLLSLPPSAAHRQRALQTPDQIITMRRCAHGYVPDIAGTDGLQELQILASDARMSRWRY
jgi:hypothetical protein